MTEQKQINLGIQVVPILKAEEGYPIIDECVKLIQDSGIKYQVTPLETVLEGTYPEIMQLVNQIYELADQAAPEIVINIRLHSKRDSHVVGADKTEKFNSL